MGEVKQCQYELIGVEGMLCDYVGLIHPRAEVI